MEFLNFVWLCPSVSCGKGGAWFSGCAASLPSLNPSLCHPSVQPPHFPPHHWKYSGWGQIFGNHLCRAGTVTTLPEGSYFSGDDTNFRSVK